jgi:uridylate kinase
MTHKEDIIAISVGGSLIVPNEISTYWLKDFKTVIENYTNRGKKFLIICGGGKTCRKYQQAAKTLGEVSKDDWDWIGIHATRINAHLLRTIFEKNARAKISHNPEEEQGDLKENILIASGWKPGWSTDYVSVLLAKKFNIKNLINLTNIDYVCDKDPNKHEDAQPIKQISWQDFRKIVGNSWSPGLNAPFDPIASKEAQLINLEVAILNGNNLKNFQNYLDDKDFKGTVIKE